MLSMRFASFVKIKETIMNGLELLKMDHRRVNELFNLVELETDLEKRKSIFREIKFELETHMYIEEMVLYPFFAEKEKFKDKIEHSFDEHQEAKSVLEEISFQSDENKFDNLIGELVKVVRYHLKTEEKETFPEMQSFLNSDELEILGMKLQEAKQAAPRAAMAA
jgi:hemerythrin superfamily protein